ncbi:MAG: hypothetical protein JWN34_5337 [Bryobacterales bacterium]|nr:hypothetical protein [Bryobacterales bacterium]
MQSRTVATLAALVPLAGAVALAGLSGSYVLPVDSEAILYSKGPVADPISRLQQRLDSGALKLKYEDEFGYLRSVLKELEVPISSQVLVFSKTSFQAPRIGPRMPRALYFNDKVSVGFVRTAEVLEFAVQDPKQGTIFYTLDQERASRPHFDRRDICLQCHQSGATMGVPGLVVRSITPDRSGMPVASAGGTVTDHRSALKERWGGWYVTGNTGNQEHMGNAIVRNPMEDERLPISEGTRNVTDLSRFFDTGAYLSPHSDIVALMALEHQTQMDNLMIRVGWEARIATWENDAINKSLGEPAGIRESTEHRINAAVEELLQYMLYSEEAKITAPITGTSGFREEFEKQGIRDSKGRSLRDFDLKKRLFKYPLSYLIYSEQFDALPEIVLNRLRTRITQVLDGQDDTTPFKHLTPEDRAAVRDILLETKPTLLSATTAGPSQSVEGR